MYPKKKEKYVSFKITEDTYLEYLNSLMNGSIRLNVIFLW